ncbi:MAG TPA: hypothetical protein VK915_09000 [Gaiellaceae bacterium]|nr:hypothetical protein [Gaiellaceae bacterium]
MTYLSPNQHELRHGLLRPERVAAPPATFARLEKRPRRRRILRAFRARFA